MPVSSSGTIRVFELQAQVGLSETATDKVLSSLLSLPHTTEFLPVYDLLLLERFSETVPLIRSALENTPIPSFASDYLSNLQHSPYYLHRMAIPAVLRNSQLPIELKREFLKRALTDPIHHVVSETVETLTTDNIFSRDDLLDAANYLSRHEFTTLRLLTVDILATLREDIPLLETILESNSWRVRLRAARLINKFGVEEQHRIATALSNDPVEEVRVHLAGNMTDLEYLHFLDDKSESVRAAYLKNIVDKLESETVFKRLMNDSSWEVKKILLNLRGEWLQRVTIPLIKMSMTNVKWRIKYDILCLIEEKMDEEHVRAGEEHVVRPLVEFILESVQDKVCEVRKKATELLVKVIERFEWCVEYKEGISRVIESRNYLHRISILPAAVLFDKKTGSEISAVLKEDPVVNVKEYYYQLVQNE